MLNEQIRKMNLIKGIFKNLDPEHQEKTLDLMTKIYQEQQEQRGQETPVIPFLKAAEARTTEEIQVTAELELPEEIVRIFLSNQETLRGILTELQIQTGKLLRMEETK